MSGDDTEHIQEIIDEIEGIQRALMDGSRFHPSDLENIRQQLVELINDE